jgi:hypothetical protein
MPRKAHLIQAHLIQAQREALAEIIGCISDSPHGDALAGRAFEILRGPMKDLVMDISNGEPDEIEESLEELRKARADVRTLGSDVS